MNQHRATLTLVAVLLAAVGFTACTQNRDEIDRLESQVRSGIAETAELRAQVEQLTDENASLTSALATAAKSTERVRHRYTRLLSYYDRVVAAVRLLAAYYGASSYRAPSYSSFHCTSSTISSYTYTNCY